MQVTFKNTGMIAEADIRFDGLTVIAGENDNGKSTVGKLMYALIKTFNRYEKDARLFQGNRINRLIDDYYFEFRKNTNDPNFLEVSKMLLEELKNNALVLVDKKESIQDTESFIAGKIDRFTETMRGLAGFTMNTTEIIKHIVEIIREKPSRDEVFKRSFSVYANSVFSGGITNKFAAAPNYTILGKDVNINIFQVTGSPSSLELNLYDTLYFEDATYFESPDLLNLADMIRFAKTGFDYTGEAKQQAELLEKAYVPEYIKDLILKLTDRPTQGKPSAIADAVREIIGGEFFYDAEVKDFVFKKKEQIFTGTAVTPGVKFLGALGILALSGFISGKSLLIIDEPETHLHPKWQIRLAEVIVQLIADGNYILLTSHSPYFLEALKLYAGADPVKDKTGFYMSEIDKARPISRIFNVTHDISPIFEILAEPFEKLELLQLKDAQ